MAISRRKFVGFTLASAAAGSLGATASLAASKTRSGSLSGRRGYNVTGTVQVVKDGGSTQVVFSDDYQFDPTKNPPDIKIAFGNGEEYAQGSHIHNELTVKSGAASFDVPASIDTDQYSELYIYCEQFTVILAVAPLN